MNGKLLVPLLVVLAGLAGCVGDPGDDATLSLQDDGAGNTTPKSEDPGASGLLLDGIVTDDALKPIPDARASLVDLGSETRTDEDGRFRFTGIPLDLFLLNITADGHLPWNEVIRRGDQTAISLAVSLTPAGGPDPYHLSVEHEGYIECAMEVLIIPGSCGRLVTEYTDMDDPFRTQSAFDHPALDGWASIVVDVVFDPLPPTLEALRVSAYSWNGTDDLGTYERFHKASGSEPFTLRLDAGEIYEDGLRVPDGFTDFRFEVFPQGHGYMDICDPTSDTCFLGVGAGTNIRFEVVITTFYHAPAPDGWTIRDA